VSDLPNRTRSQSPASGGRSSMREVAELAGVAMSSVSRVLSNHPDASAGMRERVLLAVEQLGYEPDLLAQSLRRRATLSVGFIVRDISNPLFAEIALGAETRLRQSGYSMLLTNSEGRPELDAEHLRLFARRRVDGLLLSLAAEDDPETLGALLALESPAVVLDRDLPEEIAAARVLFDHRKGMREAVSDLLDLGHRRIALIAGAPVRPTRERRAGLIEAFAERGLRTGYDVVEGMFSADHGARAMQELLERSDPPTAVIVGGNQLLAGVLRVLSERGIELGAQLSLVSCDDVDLTRVHRPGIAVISRDNRRMGEDGAELLLRAVADEDSSTSLLVLPTQYERRASCGPVPLL
jgi:LacI family transcriptional regulator